MFEFLNIAIFFNYLTIFMLLSGDTTVKNELLDNFILLSIDGDFDDLIIIQVLSCREYGFFYYSTVPQ